MGWEPGGLPRVGQEVKGQGAALVLGEGDGEQGWLGALQAPLPLPSSFLQRLDSTCVCVAVLGMAMPCSLNVAPHYPVASVPVFA